FYYNPFGYTNDNQAIANDSKVVSAIQNPIVRSGEFLIPAGANVFMYSLATQRDNTTLKNLILKDASKSTVLYNSGTTPLSGSMLSSDAILSSTYYLKSDKENSEFEDFDQFAHIYSRVENIAKDGITTYYTSEISGVWFNAGFAELNTFTSANRYRKTDSTYTNFIEADVICAIPGGVTYFKKGFDQTYYIQALGNYVITEVKFIEIESGAEFDATNEISSESSNFYGITIDNSSKTHKEYHINSNIHDFYVYVTLKEVFSIEVQIKLDGEWLDQKTNEVYGLIDPDTTVVKFSEEIDGPAREYNFTSNEAGQYYFLKDDFEKTQFISTAYQNNWIDRLSTTNPYLVLQNITTITKGKVKDTVFNYQSDGRTISISDMLAYSVYSINRADDGTAGIKENTIIVLNFATFFRLPELSIASEIVYGLDGEITDNALQDAMGKEGNKPTFEAKSIGYINSAITLKAKDVVTDSNGYNFHFVGWYSNEVLISTSPIATVNVVNPSVSNDYVAKYEPEMKRILLDFSGLKELAGKQVQLTFNNFTDSYKITLESNGNGIKCKATASDLWNLYNAEVEFLGGVKVTTNFNASGIEGSGNGIVLVEVPLILASETFVKVKFDIDNEQIRSEKISINGTTAQTRLNNIVEQPKTNTKDLSELSVSAYKYYIIENTGANTNISGTYTYMGHNFTNYYYVEATIMAPADMIEDNNIKLTLETSQDRMPTDGSETQTIYQTSGVNTSTSKTIILRRLVKYGEIAFLKVEYAEGTEYFGLYELTGMTSSYDIASGLFLSHKLGTHYIEFGEKNEAISYLGNTYTIVGQVEIGDVGENTPSADYKYNTYFNATTGQTIIEIDKNYYLFQYNADEAVNDYEVVKLPKEENLVQANVSLPYYLDSYDITIALTIEGIAESLQVKFSRDFGAGDLTDIQIITSQYENTEYFKSLKLRSDIENLRFKNAPTDKATETLRKVLFAMWDVSTVQYNGKETGRLNFNKLLQDINAIDGVESGAGADSVLEATADYRRIAKAITKTSEIKLTTVNAT
ncbi:MAG: hypothetical protein J6J23_03175, partial [Clostridia bacterium]|nr:hypothetical protein [Clostridia bacterium]